ncbi:nuclear transport factor 2 family protein [Actinomadura sp. B10D3]|uniref:nuclear transport factor 2 family protein n=1 Tax=Actinomadura sp. B10D3 TaxID=3153557 RepID=UPI00325C5C8E
MQDLAAGLLDFADYQQICRLKSRYFFCIDTKQWQKLRELFSDDATFEGFPFATEGPDAFVEEVSSWLGPIRSAHHGMMPELRMAGPRRVRGRWAMQDYLAWPQDSRVYRGVPIPGMYGMRGYGYYDEEYTLGPFGWRISFMRLTRLWIDALTDEYVEPPPYDVHAVDTGWFER